VSTGSRRGVIALALGATSISLGTIAAKQAFANGASPDDLLATRFIVAVPVLALGLPFVLRAAKAPTGRRAALVAVAAGGLFWASGWGEFQGLDRIPAGMLVLLLATASLWVATLRWAIEGIPPSFVERISIAAVIIGVAIMAVPVGVAAVDPIGILGGLISAVSFAVFLLVLERNSGMPAMAGFSIGMIGGGLLLIATDPGAIGRMPGDGLTWPLVAATGLASVGWAWLVGYGVGATDSITAAIVVALEPPLVALLALMILGEGLTARELAGGTVVIAAVVATGLQAGREERRRGAEPRAG
jgi:drug/metabolite transporter (DMT)-like permease